MGDLSHLQRWIDDSPFGLYVGEIWQHEPTVKVSVNYPYHETGDEAQKESRLLQAARLAYPPVPHEEGGEWITCPRFVGAMLQWEGGNEGDSFFAYIDDDTVLPEGWEQVIQLRILEASSEDAELAQNLSFMEEHFYEQLREHPLFPIAFPDASDDEDPTPYSVEIQIALIKEIDTGDFWKSTGGGGYELDNDQVSDSITSAISQVVDTFVRKQAREREAAVQQASFQ